MTILLKARLYLILKWQTLDNFAKRSPYLAKRHRSHNEERAAKEYHHTNNPILREDGTVNDLRFEEKRRERDQDRDFDFDR